MRLGLLGFGALLGAILVASGGESGAGVVAPDDFGPNSVVQTFDALSKNYFGTYGPLVLGGVTYDTSLPDLYTIASGSDCFSGSCFGTYVTGAALTIELSAPAESVGGYLIGRTDQTPYVIYYDANHVALDGLQPIIIDNGDAYFFGFQSDSNDIRYIEIAPNAGQGIATLDNFTYEVVGVPEPSTWTMMLLGFVGIGFAACRRIKARLGLKGRTFGS